MNRGMIAAVAMAGLIAIGCEEEKKAETPQLDKAAEKTSNEAEKAMGDLKDATKEGTEKAKDMGASAADAVQTQINDLISKAKTAVEKRDFSGAEGFIKQIEGLKSKLPADAQTKIDGSLAEIKKLIDAGKKLMPGT